MFGLLLTKLEKKEITMAIFAFVIAGAVFWSADQIPPSRLSDINAGLIPKLVALVVAGLALLHVPLNLVKRRTIDLIEDARGRDEEGQSRGNTRRMMLTVCLLGALVFLVEYEIVPFAFAGFFFVYCAVLALSELTLRSILKAGIVAGATMVFTVLVFTQVFTVILP